ncbi:MAG: TIGR04219 family outer membrane beta-barrel protein [Desulfobacteraceae bacterium]|nr:TIGR04219 family outer membrane beta-barrel protein [Desulfobacteraceae bacterium]
MKKHMWTFMILCILSIGVNTGAAGVEVALGGWYHLPTGEMSYKGDGVNDDIDIADDFGFDAETRFHGRLKIETPLLLPNLYLVAAPMEFEGTEERSVSFQFGDETFVAGFEYDTRMTVNQYDIGLFYGIPGVRTATAGKFNIDLGLNARILDMTAEIEQDLLTEKAELVLPIPMIYAGFQIKPVERISLEGELRGVTYENNSLFSLIGRVKVNITGPVFAAAAYRYERVLIDTDDIEVDAVISGPMAEVGFEF